MGCAPSTPHRTRSPTSRVSSRPRNDSLLSTNPPLTISSTFSLPLHPSLPPSSPDQRSPEDTHDVWMVPWTPTPRYWESAYERLHRSTDSSDDMICHRISLEYELRDSSEWFRRLWTRFYESCEAEELFLYPPPLSCPSRYGIAQYQLLVDYFRWSTPTLDHVESLILDWREQQDVAQFIPILDSIFAKFSIDPEDIWAILFVCIDLLLMSNLTKSSKLIFSPILRLCECLNNHMLGGFLIEKFYELFVLDIILGGCPQGGWKIGQSSHVKILLKNVTEAHTRRFAEHEMRFSSARDETVSTALCRASFFGVGPRNESVFDGEQSSTSSSSAERDRLTKEWLRRFHEVFKSRQREISELAASLRLQAAENRYEDAREERKNEPRTFEKEIHSKPATVTSRIVESLEQYFSTTESNICVPLSDVFSSIHARFKGVNQGEENSLNQSNQPKIRSSSKSAKMNPRKSERILPFDENVLQSVSLEDLYRVFAHWEDEYEGSEKTRSERWLHYLTSFFDDLVRMAQQSLTGNLESGWNERDRLLRRASDCARASHVCLDQSMESSDEELPHEHVIFDEEICKLAYQSLSRDHGVEESDSKSSYPTDILPGLMDIDPVDLQSAVPPLSARKRSNASKTSKVNSQTNSHSDSAHSRRSNSLPAVNLSDLHQEYELSVDEKCVLDRFLRQLAERTLRIEFMESVPHGRSQAQRHDVDRDIDIMSDGPETIDSPIRHYDRLSDRKSSINKKTNSQQFSPRSPSSPSHPIGDPSAPRVRTNRFRDLPHASVETDSLSDNQRSDEYVVEEPFSVDISRRVPLYENVLSSKDSSQSREVIGQDKTSDEEDEEENEENMGFRHPDSASRREEYANAIRNASKNLDYSSDSHTSSANSDEDSSSEEIAFPVVGINRSTTLPNLMEDHPPEFCNWSDEEPSLFVKMRQLLISQEQRRLQEENMFREQFFNDVDVLHRSRAQNLRFASAKSPTSPSSGFQRHGIPPHVYSLSPSRSSISHTSSTEFVSSYRRNLSQSFADAYKGVPTSRNVFTTFHDPVSHFQSWKSS